MEVKDILFTSILRDFIKDVPASLLRMYQSGCKPFQFQQPGIKTCLKYSLNPFKPSKTIQNRKRILNNSHVV